jgi:hypothetical protein
MRVNLEQAQKLWQKLSRAKAWSYVAKRELRAGQEWKLKPEIK